MICLPRLVWPFGAAAENEFIPIPGGHRPFQGESDKCRIKGADNFPDRRVVRRWQLPLLRVGDGEAVQCYKARAWARQRQPFDERRAAVPTRSLTCPEKMSVQRRTMPSPRVQTRTYQSAGLWKRIPGWQIPHAGRMTTRKGFTTRAQGTGALRDDPPFSTSRDRATGSLGKGPWDHHLVG